VKALLVILVASFIATASAQSPVTLHNGFLKGEEYLKLSKPKRTGYATGLVDGIFLSVFFGGNDNPRLRKFEKAVEGMSDEQVEAIVTKYIQDHPEEWHLNSHMLAYRAFLKALKLDVSQEKEPTVETH
jgi:hypothetical protein